MSSRQVFAAAKCLACGLPKMGAVGNWVMSGAQQASQFLRTAAVIQGGRSLSSATPFSSPLVQKALRVSSNTSISINSARIPSSASQANFMVSNTPMLMQTRGRRDVYYRPSAWKRINKHGIERRLRTQGGIEVLWRRILKKRHSLTPFDRILPGTVKGQILPDHYLKYNQHLVNKEVRKRVNQAIRKK